MRKSYCLMLVILASGCAALDPYERPRTWSATDSNNANLRVMIADPNDLANGVDMHDTLAAEAAPPISRLLSGQRTPLPASGASLIGATNASLPPPPVSTGQ